MSFCPARGLLNSEPIKCLEGHPATARLGSQRSPELSLEVILGVVFQTLGNDLKFGFR
jgi:hypothetical protein